LFSHHLDVCFRAGAHDFGKQHQPNVSFTFSEGGVVGILALKDGLEDVAEGQFV